MVVTTGVCYVVHFIKNDGGAVTKAKRLRREGKGYDYEKIIIS